MRCWADRNEVLTELAARQIFFVGGAPRSGTTWLQRILDSHPDVSCRGEALFLNRLAIPLETMMGRWREAIAEKNTTLFRDTGGYPLPVAEDVEFLIGTAIMQALHRQSASRPCLAVGEKTPDNTFFFPRLKRLFPAAKFIAIARDPRDVLTSAWHFFHAPANGESQAEAATIDAMTAFIRGALPSLDEGTRALVDFSAQHPSDCMVVTYEELRRAPEPVVARLFRLLGVSDRDGIVETCLERTSFTTLTGGRPAGVTRNGSFFRKGVVGDWASTLTPEMNAMVLDKLGWMFPHFGWQAWPDRAGTRNPA